MNRLILYIYSPMAQMWTNGMCLLFEQFFQRDDILENTAVLVLF